MPFSLLQRAQMGNTRLLKGELDVYPRSKALTSLEDVRTNHFTFLLNF